MGPQKNEWHFETVDSYLESYRSYLLMWSHYVGDVDGPKLRELRAELDKYMRAYKAYLRSEALLIVNSAPEARRAEAKTDDIFDAIDKRIKAHRRYLLEMARLVPHSQRDGSIK